MINQGFLSDDFLLQSEAARVLYHKYAEDMPIYDFHTHLPAQALAGDVAFENMSKIWLNGDHYKWRAMRANGVDEKYITGEGSDWEKWNRVGRRN
jgi:glucuronate isomerase